MRLAGAQGPFCGLPCSGLVLRCTAFLESHRRRATTGSSTASASRELHGDNQNDAEQHQLCELQSRIEANIVLAESELYCVHEKMEKARAACYRACSEIESAGPVMIYGTAEGHRAVSRRLEAACSASDALEAWASEHPR